MRKILDRRAPWALLSTVVLLAGVVVSNVGSDAPATLRTDSAAVGADRDSIDRDSADRHSTDRRAIDPDATGRNPVGPAVSAVPSATADGDADTPTADGAPVRRAPDSGTAPFDGSPTTEPAPATARPSDVGRATAQAPAPQANAPSAPVDHAEHAVPMTQDRAAPPVAASPTTTRPPTTTTRPPSTTTTTPQGVWRPMRTNADGSVVRYDPCTPIRYVTRLTGGPSFARAELDWAIAQLEATSGLDLVWAGDVATTFSDAWAAVNDTAHVGFATPAEFWLPAGVSGYGDSAPVSLGGRQRLTDGRVVLRPDHGWTQGTSSANPLGLMFLHELGHLVGLAHVDVATELMTDRGNGTMRSLGHGDRRGLAAVGRPAGCL